MHGRSMEDEARDILRSALSASPRSGQSLIEAIRARVSPLGQVDLVLAPGEAIRNPPQFDT